MRKRSTFNPKKGGKREGGAEGGKWLPKKWEEVRAKKTTFRKVSGGKGGVGLPPFLKEEEGGKKP